MALPNVGLGNAALNNKDNDAFGKKRMLANESKAMDEVFGSNVSKDYNKIAFNRERERLERERERERGLPQLAPIDTNIKPMKVNPNNFQQDNRPPSQDRNLDRQGSREAMEAFRSHTLNYRPEPNEKVEGLERTVKYLIDQINTFEKMMYNESRRNKTYFDTEKEHVERLETALKLYEDNFSLGNSDLANKFNLLEARLLREEKAKIELREKLNYAENNQRELLEYVKSLQKQENQELSQMRAILQEKLTEDQGFAVKEKERSKTLFHEVVRLGEQNERSSEALQAINLAMESRLQAMEAKYQVSERALSALTERGATGLNTLSDWNGKVEQKVQSLESNMYALTREQVKDKETIARLEAINSKLSDDLSQLLHNLNSDYNQKLDARVTELVNRIVMEHEERVRNHDDFRQQVDIKDQINAERSQYEREEMRERYNSMDALVRAEFERKDEAIRTLHNIVETQVRALQAALKQEELSRNQFESYLREEMGRFQDDTRREFDGFRQQQTITTEKLTEMIKIEIDTRLSSDIELKNQINTIAHNISQDIETLKDNLEVQIEGIAKELRTVAADSAERANQLSRYIDQEVNNVAQNFNTKYEKLKVLFAKFGEQFKNHLLNTEAFRKETLTKVQEIEQTIEFNKEESHNKMASLEKRTDEKFKEQKELFAVTIDNNNRVLEDKMNKVKEQEEGDVEVLKEAIENSRTIFNNKIEKLMELNDVYHNNVANTLAKVLADLDSVKNNIYTVKEELHDIHNSVGEDISDLRAYMETQLLTERSIRSELIEDVYEALKKNINEINSSLNSLRLADDRLGKNMDEMVKRYDDRFHNFSDQISDAFLKIAGLNDNLANFEERSKEDHVQMVSQMTADHLIAQSDTKMLFTELRRVVEAVSKENGKTRVFQERITNFLINLNKESDYLKQKVEKEILASVDSKLFAVLEKVKKQDQELWEKTLYHVNNNFMEAKPMVNPQTSAKGQLHELVTQDDTFQDPFVKGKPKANAPNGNKTNAPQQQQPQAQSQPQSQPQTQRK